MKCYERAESEMKIQNVKEGRRVRRAEEKGQKSEAKI